MATDIHNTRPVSSAPSTRMSREQREKEYLKNRREGFARYDPQQIDEPLKVKPEAKGVFLSDADRFHTDVAGEERRRREQQGQAQGARLMQKRAAAMEREEKRWEHMGAAAAAEEDRISRKRELGLAAKKNAPSLPFNSITLSYESSREGAQLQHRDNLSKYRAALRTHNLYTRQNGEYNPITGQPRLSVAPPAKPDTPQR